MTPIITVDGPSGAGKGTLSARLTQFLGWHFLDSGALYRLTGLAATNHGVAFDNEPALSLLAEHLDVRFDSSGERTLIFLEGDDVTDTIRTEDVGAMASKVAAVQVVRDALLNRQRAFQEAPGLVADGRDMGTVIFPEAELKLFLTASPEERAKRRYLQLKDKGHDVSIARLAEEIRLRDERDTNRSVSPLKPADDAFVIDSSGLNIDEVTDLAIQQVKKKGLAPS